MSMFSAYISVYTHSVWVPGNTPGLQTQTNYPGLPYSMRAVLINPHRYDCRETSRTLIARVGVVVVSACYVRVNLAWGKLGHN